jgi:putative YhbY family RNA-binding protein
MTAIQLTPAQRKEKRGEAHHLDPVVIIGADGLTEAVVKETEVALKAHGLIKVRMFSDVRADREAALASLADRLGAAPVQHIGKLLVLWRPIPDKTPDPRGERNAAAPRIVKILKFSKNGSGRPQIKKIKVFGNERLTAGGEVKRARKRVTSVKKKAVD